MMIAIIDGGPGIAQMALAMYAYLLPLLLYVCWSVLALFDLTSRDDAAGMKLWGWCAAIFLFPFIGAAAYLLVGGAKLNSMTVRASVFGGIGIYVAVLLVGQLIGGIA